ncbi:His-Xaa-Ser system radical SAM maturase HxsB [Tardiphaga sp. OK245]|uniref:His-Xaa-Ser system radical SAM maturase HxsB n=1 Tax=Tardiphaga sp. OK245 TaxID=1855306 RepID=UPI0024C06185|nr:His-Xaa-Ser system radical SAM maturase HxsB [Tardiphaga sp. OK245]
MPIRFSRLRRSPGHFVATSEAGEAMLLDEASLSALAAGRPLPEPLARDLEARQMIVRDNGALAARLLATKLRTRKSFLRGGPALHIFVVTLSCDHSCKYCQVSRTFGGARMSAETASAAVDRLFESPARDLTVEFQGGEPLLALDVVEDIVRMIRRRNEDERRTIRFTMTSTLHHLDDHALEFLARESFHLSTSLDGPADIHDANRPLPSKDSHARTVAGIDRARAVLGIDAVAALTTITRRSLEAPEAVVDEYVRLGFKSIFLRPLSPFGFASKGAKRQSYDAGSFLTFYERALQRILELNAQGIEIEEVYASLLLRGILTPYPSGYVDLRSPVGAGFGTLVYNYDGGVYASDEGRMLAEMGDHALRLGHVDESYATLMTSDAMQLLAASGLAESLPGCSDCAFVHYCGPDPARALSTTGVPVDHKASSDHCIRHTGLFELMFDLLHHDDDRTIATLYRWAHGRPSLRDRAAV